MLKKIAVLATVAVLSTYPLFAAAEGGPEGRPEGRPSPEERLNRMQKHLNLSDDQVSQIREIHKNGGGREEVADVLTDDQRAQVRKHHKQREAQHRQAADGNSQSTQSTD